MRPSVVVVCESPEAPSFNRQVSVLGWESRDPASFLSPANNSLDLGSILPPAHRDVMRSSRVATFRPAYQRRNVSDLRHSGFVIRAVANMVNRVVVVPVGNQLGAFGPWDC